MPVRGAAATPGVMSGCPNGSKFPDGCAAAVAATVVHPDFFTGYARQSGQGPYLLRPLWNVAGVDYPVGAPMGVALKDPRLLDGVGGCALGASGAYRTLTCSPSGALTISGYDFSGATGGTGCTRLLISRAAYPITVTGNNFVNGAGCAGAGSFLLEVDSLSTGPVTLTSNTFDGMAPVQTAALVAQAALMTTGNITVEYNAFLHSPCRPLIYFGGQNSKEVKKYNYIEGYIYQDGSVQGHGEFEVISLGAGETEALDDNEFNTVLQPNTVYSQIGHPGTVGSNTAFYISLATTSAGIANAIVGYNTTVINTNAISGGFTTATSVTNLHLGVFGAIVFKGNFTDMTGTAGGRTAFTATGPGVCKTRAAFGAGASANIDMLTGKVIPGWLSNTATGC